MNSEAFPQVTSYPQERIAIPNPSRFENLSDVAAAMKLNIVKGTGIFLFFPIPLLLLVTVVIYFIAKAIKRNINRTNKK